MNDDLISRQAAIDALESIGSLDTEADREYARSVFEALPSAQTERKKGEWVKKVSQKIKDKEYIGYTPYWYCPECGKRYEPAVANTIINYCYNCGTKIEEVENE